MGKPYSVTVDGTTRVLGVSTYPAGLESWTGHLSVAADRRPDTDTHGDTVSGPRAGAGTHLPTHSDMLISQGKVAIVRNMR